jgi:hypothetical protein
MEQLPGRALGTGDDAEGQRTPRCSPNARGKSEVVSRADWCQLGCSVRRRLVDLGRSGCLSGLRVARRVGRRFADLLPVSGWWACLPGPRSARRYGGLQSHVEPFLVSPDPRVPGAGCASMGRATGAAEWPLEPREPPEGGSGACRSEGHSGGPICPSVRRPGRPALSTKRLMRIRLAQAACLSAVISS